MNRPVLPKPIGLLRKNYSKSHLKIEKTTNRIKSIPTNWTMNSHWATNIGRKRTMHKVEAFITPGQTEPQHLIFQVIQKLSLNDSRSDVLDQHRYEVEVRSDDVVHARSRSIRYRVSCRRP